MKYIYLETYGCSANQNNSEILRGLLKQSGYEITNNMNIAEIIIINTCIVKQKTENKIKRKIQDLSKIYPNKLLIISGCMPETDFKELKKLNSNLLFLGTHNFKQITKLIKDFNDNKLTETRQKSYLDFNKETKLNLPKIPENKLISITQISEGCLGNCSFCKTRLAKQGLFSYTMDKILKSIESDLKQGVKEVWITSQDNACYGLDFKDNKSKKSKLPELLEKILLLPHKFKLRLGMMNPNNLLPILDELIEIYKNNKMYKFLHIPIQSASDKLLKDMNRKYKLKDVEFIIKKFKKQFPDLTIATDIITGYPNENQKDHNLNLDFIKTFKPDVFNLSKFSLHKKTPIYEKIKNKSLNQIEIKTINKRTAELMSEHRKTAKQNKQRYLDKEISVFVNKKTDFGFEARDENYNIILINSREKSLLGKNINVKIKQIGVHHMIGEIKK